MPVKRYRRKPVEVKAYPYNSTVTSSIIKDYSKDIAMLQRAFPKAEFKEYDGKLCVKNTIDSYWVPLTHGQMLIEGIPGEEYYTYEDSVFRDLYDEIK